MMGVKHKFTTSRVGATLKQNIFESYLNRADKVVVVLDQNLRVRILNSFGQTVLRQTLKEVMGSEWVEVVWHEDRERVGQVYGELWRSGSSETLKNEFRLSVDGARMWSWQHFAVKDRAGVVQAILSVGEDVTVLKRNEQLLKRREALLKSLSDSSGYFLQATAGEWERNVLAVLEQIGRALGSGRVYACKNRQPVTDDPIMFLKYEWKHWGETHVFDGFEAHHHAYSGVGLSRFAERLNRREILTLNVSEMAAGERQWNVAEQAQHLLIVPVFVGVEWWGYLGFEDWGNGKEVTNEELEVLKALSVTFGAAIQRKRIEEELEREKKLVEQKVEERTQQLKLTQMELERALMEIRQEKARLTASIHSLSMGFVMVNLSGEVMLYNHAVNNILEPDRERAVDSLPKKWTMESLAEKLQPLVNVQAMVRECVESNTELKTNELEYGDTYIRLSLTPIKMVEDDGQAIGVVLLIHDVTEAKRLELTRDEFFAVAAHELRTPLTAIKGNAAMIQHYYKEVSEHPDVGKMIQDIADSSGRLIEMVNEYLDVTRAELKKMKLNLEPVMVYDTVKQAMDQLQATVAERNLSWDLVSNVPGDTQVMADQARLLQVMTNLLGNSIKYTQEGGVGVTISGENGVVIIRVSDTGRGIEADEQESLFQKFKQVGEKVYITDPVQGTGMGLYISRLLVESMHGKIYLEKSEVGRGSTFAVQLPMAEI